MPTLGGGGGYFHNYVRIFGIKLCAARETPIFSPEFPFRSISFSQITKRYQPVHRLSWPAQPERRFAAVLEIRIFTLKTDQARSGDSHFHAQTAQLSSFRSPTFSRSSGSPFRSSCPFFTLPRHIPTKIWGEYPAPRAPPDAECRPHALVLLFCFSR